MQSTLFAKQASLSTKFLRIDRMRRRTRISIFEFQPGVIGCWVQRIKKLFQILIHFSCFSDLDFYKNREKMTLAPQRWMASSVYLLNAGDDEIDPLWQDVLWLSGGAASLCIAKIRATQLSAMLKLDWCLEDGTIRFEEIANLNRVESIQVNSRVVQSFHIRHACLHKTGSLKNNAIQLKWNALLWTASIRFTFRYDGKEINNQMQPDWFRICKSSKTNPASQAGNAAFASMKEKAQSNKSSRDKPFWLQIILPLLHGMWLSDEQLNCSWWFSSVMLIQGTINSNHNTWVIRIMFATPSVVIIR